MKRTCALIRVGDTEYKPSEIAGRYVRKLRLAAERQLGLDEGSIRRAVVAVPASFGGAQIEATLKACENAGLVEVHLIDEPVAAAYSLMLHEAKEPKTVLVADLGGGTFDVTLLRVGKSVGTLGYHELGRDGELLLGGLDWDREIAAAPLRTPGSRSARRSRTFQQCWMGKVAVDRRSTATSSCPTTRSTSVPKLPRKSSTVSSLPPARLLPRGSLSRSR